MMKLKSKIYGIATLYWMLFIYGFSAESGSVSGGKSMKLAAFFERIFKNTIGRGLSYNTGDVVFTISHIMRKCAHMAGFFILAVLVFLLIESIAEKRKLLSPIAFSVLFAASDEFHQMFVPGRGPSINDVGIDSCGVVLGVMFTALILKRARKKVVKLYQKEW
ncbi:MAG: VanZ family protein [Oscillospiraceae bacterium]|nr:VanZ family protein [Oscillospiraceae bacterium]